MSRIPTVAERTELLTVKQKLREYNAPLDILTYTPDQDMVTYLNRAKRWITQHETHQKTLTRHQEALEKHKEDLEEQKFWMRKGKKYFIKKVVENGERLMDPSDIFTARERYDRNVFVGDKVIRNTDMADPYHIRNSSKTSRLLHGMDAMSFKEQHFKHGGIVKGRNNAPVEVVAHQGELIIPKHMVHEILQSKQWNEHIKDIQKQKHVSHTTAALLAKGFKKKTHTAWV